MLGARRLGFCLLLVYHSLSGPGRLTNLMSTVLPPTRTASNIEAIFLIDGNEVVRR